VWATIAGLAGHRYGQAMDVSSIETRQGLSDAEKGVALAVMAHFVWGGMAYYFGLIRYISPIEIATQRALWALPIAVVVVILLKQAPTVLKTLRNRRAVATLALTSALVAFNWGLYVWSIEVGRTLDSSLGYFINPLLNVVVGYLFLGERFTTAQKIALGLATIAVLIQTVALGAFPWLGLSLAGTFCLYGFLRKTIPVGATEGFLIEVGLLAVPMLAAEYWLFRTGQAHFGSSWYDSLMLIGCGVATATSLMLYASSIRRLRYSTAGLLQYMSPSLVFLTAVFIFREPLSVWKLVSFAIIWVALAIFSFAALRDERAKRLSLGTA
jgi:chloramphenicol-sensitive protein RarD